MTYHTVGSIAGGGATDVRATKRGAVAEGTQKNLHVLGRCFFNGLRERARHYATRDGVTEQRAHEHRDRRRDVAVGRREPHRLQAHDVIGEHHRGAVGTFTHADGGFGPLFACDLAIAADEAQFGLSEVNWGILPGGGVTKAVVDLLSMRDAMYLALLRRTA